LKFGVLQVRCKPFTTYGKPLIGRLYCDSNTMKINLVTRISWSPQPVEFLEWLVSLRNFMTTKGDTES